MATSSKYHVSTHAYIFKIIWLSTYTAAASILNSQTHTVGQLYRPHTDGQDGSTLTVKKHRPTLKIEKIKPQTVSYQALSDIQWRK